MDKFLSKSTLGVISCRTLLPAGTLDVTDIYRVIQSSCKKLEVVGDHLEHQKCNLFFIFSTVSELRCFYADVTFITVIADFCKMETVRES
jgi:hypothetical protein